MKPGTRGLMHGVYARLRKYGIALPKQRFVYHVQKGGEDGENV